MAVNPMTPRIRFTALFLLAIAAPAVAVAIFAFGQPGVIGLTIAVLAAVVAFATLGSRIVAAQLQPQLEELAQQRRRLRESIRRTGQTLASNLDRPALLEVALKTAVDGVHADCGRLVARSAPQDPLTEISLIGNTTGLESLIHGAETAALRNGDVGESHSGDTFLASVALGHANPLDPRVEQSGRLYGLMTVGRAGRRFTDEECDVLRLLAAQATLALENVELHYQIRRQAVTDELTGLGNYARFQELLATETGQVKRYGDPVGLIMLDLDDFKEINDSFGHQQGDAVLRHVARALRETSREADSPARYGGDELVVVLPRTDLDGAFTIGERVRRAIEQLEVPRVDNEGSLRVTASVGVAASDSGDKEALVADADRALYAAKREGKNRAAKAQAETAKVLGE
jgi:two-component system cell cycle response regulator